MQAAIRGLLRFKTALSPDLFRDLVETKTSMTLGTDSA